MDSNFVEFVRSSIESSIGITVTSSDGLIIIITTSVAVILGFSYFVWKKSSSESKPIVVPKAVSVVPDDDEENEIDVGSGKTKLTIFFGTQTGTAEGFAKVIDTFIYYVYIYLILFFSIFVNFGGLM